MGGGFLVSSRESVVNLLKFCLMTDLLNLIESGQTNLVVQVRGEDLLKFTEELIARAAEQERARIEACDKSDALLTKEAVMKLLGVCSATLWQWEKRSYLIPVKAGRKVMYRKADVDKLLCSSTGRQ